MAFYCVTKSREPTTNKSDMFSALVCTLFVSVDDSCFEYFLINVKPMLHCFHRFWTITAPPTNISVARHTPMHIRAYLPKKAINTSGKGKGGLKNLMQLYVRS